MNYSGVISDVQSRNDDVRYLGDALADTIQRLGKAGRSAYEAKKAYEDAKVLAIYRESLKAGSVLSAGKNAEDRKLAREAFEVSLGNGELKGLAMALDMAQKNKADLESQVASLQAKFEAIKIAQAGDVAILGCKD